MTRNVVLVLAGLILMSAAPAVAQRPSGPPTTIIIPGVEQRGTDEARPVGERSLEPGRPAAGRPAAVPPGERTPGDGPGTAQQPMPDQSR